MARPFLLPLFCVSMLFNCRDSRDKLLEDIQSPYADKRARAVKSLAKKPLEENLVLLTQAAKDTDPSVRQEAILALGKSKDEQVIDILGELIADPNEDVQADAAMALAERRHPKATAHLISQYARRGQATRWVIVKALKAANIPGAMAQVVVAESRAQWERNLRALNEGVYAERVGAAVALGKSGRVEAVERLMPLLKSPSVRLASAAAIALGYTRDKRAVAPVRELFSSNDPQLRWAACEALALIQEPDSIPALQTIALEQSATSPMATTALMSFPPEAKVNQSLCEVALNAGTSEAAWAADEMRRRGGCPLEPFLRKIQTGQPTNQTAALKALRALAPSTKEIWKQLGPLVHSKDFLVRREVFELMARLPDASWRNEFEQSVEADVQFLDSLRSNLATSPKTSRLGDYDEREVTLNVAAGLAALGAMKSESSSALLQRFLNDKNITLRMGAQWGRVLLANSSLEPLKEGLHGNQRTLRSQLAARLAFLGAPGQKLLMAAIETPMDATDFLDAIFRAGPSEEINSELVSGLERLNAHPAIVRALGVLKKSNAVEPLTKLLSQSSLASRNDVIWALGEIGDARARAALTQALYNDSAEVRATAAKSLEKIGADSSLEELEALRSDYDLRVRTAALEALNRHEQSSQTAASPVP